MPHRLLRLRDGDRVLHLGGDSEALAALVGTAGTVSETALTSELPFHANSFDAALVQHSLATLEDPAGGVGELAWVVRGGGRIALCEPDWESLSIGGVDRDITRLIVRQLANGRADIGRDLPHYLGVAGCHRIQVQPEVLVFRRIADLEAALDIGAAALACVGAETAEHWRQSLIERESDDCFYAAVTIVQAVGKVMG